MREICGSVDASSAAAAAVAGGALCCPVNMDGMQDAVTWKQN